MGNTGRDPVDHSRTTRKWSGETMKNTATTPGLILGAIAVVAFVIGLFMFATSHTTRGVVAEVVAVVAGAAAVVWILTQHRRVIRAEVALKDQHPDVDVEPPTA